MSGEQGEALAIDEYPQPRKTLDAEPYWQGVEENRLMFQRCVQTGRAIFPPRQESPATEMVVSWSGKSQRARARFIHSAPFIDHRWRCLLAKHPTPLG